MTRTIQYDEQWPRGAEFLLRELIRAIKAGEDIVIRSPLPYWPSTGPAAQLWYEIKVSRDGEVQIEVGSELKKRKPGVEPIKEISS